MANSPTQAKESSAALFIVDNSDSDWKVRSYLTEWCELSKAIDIATGYFEIGSLLALEGKWQAVDHFRILMGDEVSMRTKRAFAEGLKKIAQRLDASLEAEKAKDDFLAGVPAIVAAIRAGKIECRVYRKDKFHAKAYITHARSAVVGSSALVGSSNFTFPGLCENVELNVRISSSAEVGLLQEWYERHWQDAEDITPDILRTLERHTDPRTPFEVWFKALHEFCSGHELTPDEWDTGESVVFPQLARYQQDAYKNLVGIARLYGGAFLCDGVGLGKTFVGLMLIERFVRKEKKNVVLFAPKAARFDVWEPVIRELLPDLNSGFVNLLRFSHTDLQKKGDAPDHLRRTLRDADIVLIDEAHHFRNPGVAGQEESNPSRYRLLQEALHQPGARPKQIFFLTATPINNSVHDFRHILGLVTGRDDRYFAEGARNLGIHSVRGHFIALEKKLLAQQHVATAEQLDLAGTVLPQETLFEKLVVQRSRSYVKESQRLIAGGGILFPTRETPRVAAYNLKATYGRLLESVEKAFSKTKPLFALAIYYPLGYLRHEEEASLETGRQAQVVALIRVQFLKRFESSAHAFEKSCGRLLKKLLVWVEAHTVSAHDRGRLEKWKLRNSELIGYVHEHQTDLWPGETEDEQPEDFVTAEEIEAVETVDAATHKVDEMLDDTYDDLNQLADFLKLVGDVKPERDDKLKALITLLKKDKALAGRKVLVFSEFADTARYLQRELTAAGVPAIERIDGSSTQRQRTAVIHRFAPFYNHTTPAALDGPEIQTLIATDVLAEGLNLQDASRLINYDLHWNPVRLMQRIGRVDRRMNAATEAQIIAAHPELAHERGEQCRIIFWNFLPPAELNDLLRIYEKVSHKVLTISKTLGLEGGTLLHPDQQFDPVKEFNERYDGKIPDTEELLLEYHRLQRDHPDLAATLDKLPLKLFTGKAHPTAGVRAVFFCFRIPRPDPALVPTDTGELRWSDPAGFTVWIASDLTGDRLATDPAAIADLIRSLPDTPRRTALDRAELSALRKRIEKELTTTHLRALQAPPGVTPVLKCWMELN